LAYDAWRGRTVLFGGLSNHGELNDLWEYDGVNWSQVVAAAPPSPRWEHALAFDMARGRMLMFGGESPSGGAVVMNDTAELVPAAVASWARYGPGCAGSAGVPSLDALPNATPAVGGPFTLRFTSLSQQQGSILLAFGFDLTHWNSTALPLSLAPVGLPGCRLWIGPAPGGTRMLSHPGSAMNFTFTIPANQALAGLVAATQGLVLDAGAPGGIGSVTNAGIMRVY
jgi:hypothetical protein